jgi:hypothetical protein
VAARKKERGWKSNHWGRGVVRVRGLRSRLRGRAAAKATVEGARPATLKVVDLRVGRGAREVAHWQRKVALVVARVATLKVVDLRVGRGAREVAHWQRKAAAARAAARAAGRAAARAAGRAAGKAKVKAAEVKAGRARMEEVGGPAASEASTTIRASPAEEAVVRAVVPGASKAGGELTRVIGGAIVQALMQTLLVRVLTTGVAMKAGEQIVAGGQMMDGGRVTVERR